MTKRRWPSRLITKEVMFLLNRVNKQVLRHILSLDLPVDPIRDVQSHFNCNRKNELRLQKLIAVTCNLVTFFKVIVVVVVDQIRD